MDSARLKVELLVDILAFITELFGSRDAPDAKASFISFSPGRGEFCIEACGDGGESAMPSCRGV